MSDDNSENVIDNDASINYTYVRLKPSHFDELMHNPQTMLFMLLIFIACWTALLLFCIITNPKSKIGGGANKEPSSKTFHHRSSVPRISEQGLKSLEGALDNLEHLTYRMSSSKLSHLSTLKSKHSKS